MSLRIFSFGDIHYNTTALGRVIAFINSAVTQNKCDFVVQSGDLCSSSYNSDLSELTDLKDNYFDNLNVPYFIVPGNHDVIDSTCTSVCSDHVGSPRSCNYRTVFGDPNWLKTFTKDETTYQLIGVSICPDTDQDIKYYWIFDFEQYGISDTLPTILLNHGPIVIPSDTECGSWDSSTYQYAISQNLKGQIDLLKVIVSYSGHVHAPRVTVINNRLFVSENTISDSNERCTEDSTRFIGYTKITHNDDDSFTIQYQTIRYQNVDGTIPAFVDPFPDDCIDPECDIQMLQQ